jgi:hypothetical protein
MNKDTTYKACSLRNSGDAYRQFRSSGFLGRIHETAVGLLRQRLVGAAIAVMGGAGLIGALITFWPR